MSIPRLNIPRIVIVGGGFGGLMLAQKLKDQEVQVVLVDQNNYHTFQPLLYQVATSGLEPDSILQPIRKVLKDHPNYYFRIAKAKRVIPEKNILVTNKGEIDYDYLVLATGSLTNFFGSQNIKKLSMPMKTVREALNLRSLILQNFEDALMTTDLKEREKLMNHVIVGGGPTGVELAGALAELKDHVLPNDYPDLDLRQMNIHLLDSGPRLLRGMSEESSAKAMGFLKKMGVNVWLNTMVMGYDGDEIETNSKKCLPAKTLIWAAGVKGASVKGIHNDLLDDRERIKVDEFNRMVGHENIFAVGDVATMISNKYPKGHPMLASAATQQGVFLAKNFINLLKGRPLQPFKFKNKGTMATIGRNKAVADFPKFRLQGILAWYAWMFVHLILLVGFRNKFMAFLNWTWSYFNYDQSTRLIVRPYHRKRLKPLMVGNEIEDQIKRL